MSDDTGRLAETRQALRVEIGPPTDRDGKWQPMVSAGEVRLLLDALDAADARVAAARADALAPIEALINKIEREIAEQLAKLQLPDDGSGGFVRTCDIRAAIHTSNTTEENHEPT